MIFLANSSYDNSTNSSSFCDAKLHPFVHNLTSSYADQRNEVTMVFTSVFMFMLAALIFNLNLFSGLSTLSAILNPTIRRFLSTLLSLFLPVMTYLFSEAKNQGAALAAISPTSSSYSHLGTELSLRARTILFWMLLVELLRKKVEAILDNGGRQWYSNTIDRAARIAWLGYLIFYNLRTTGKKVIYGTLWVLAAAKLVQRVAINQLLKRSFTYGKNAKLLSSYMAQKLQEQDQQADEEGAKLLNKCKYAVMGEENLEADPGPEGYHLELKKTTTVDTGLTIVTIGDIWSLAADPEKEGGLLRQDPSLKRLCLSFALYKLLRRRFEDLPITREETCNCRGLIFRGLRKELLQGAEVDEEDLKGTVVAVQLFQVFDEEIQFLCEYYHSVLPVVLSNPFFFFANYILFPIVVWAFCLLTFIICGNGDLRYAYRSITSDNYIISAGMMNIAGCLLRRIIHSPEALFTTVDLAITMLLFLSFLYEQLWDFIVFILSKWLMVSLVCEYTAKRRWCDSRILCGLISGILWVRRKISGDSLCFKQFSMLVCGRLPSMMLPKKAVPMQVKKSIMEFLVAQTQIDGHAATLSNGWSTLQSQKHIQYGSRLSLACESKSVAEVILVWHIATSLLDREYQLQKKKNKKNPIQMGSSGLGAHHKVAATLSGYCAYLVALCPGLLPGNKDGTKHVYKKMQEQLKKEVGGCWRYRLSLPGTRYDKLLEIAKGWTMMQWEGMRGPGSSDWPEASHAVTGAPPAVGSGGAVQIEVQWEERRMVRWEEMTMVQRGAKLGQTLIEMAGPQQEEGVWELLADLWTELMVYVAPSGGELHVKAHKKKLVQGGEFITVLWALCTHTGITRPDLAPWEAEAQPVPWEHSFK